ncbi:FecR family protein [Dyadobacter sp. CY312]|uniref:FecR family protein n=1 Tax=Dyadobacter sp. CY312 TaxID=2907303 RepID=UPI001F24451B|nr:FecR family protein [Dyadobacter sp. CY312]MCE7043769.1 FecR domain-containing protein [Dyadobacter sp. CY312]
MNNYNDFKSGDFIADPAFRAWVYGFKQQSDIDWEYIASQSHSVGKEMEIARLFLKNIEDKTIPVSDLYIERFSERILENHRKLSPSIKLSSRRWYEVSSRLFYMAAAIIMSFGIGWFYYTYSQKQSVNTDSISWAAPEQKLTSRVNRTKSPELVVLKDGSKITLQPNSTITYHEAFDGAERNVQLEGEAFFDVVKNPDRPFLVYFNDLTVRVLGTSFNIRSYGKEEGSRVTVKTGKVSVSANRETSPPQNHTDLSSSAIMLTANQEVFYKKAQGYFERSVASRTQIVDKTISENDFVFNETPLSTIFSKLDKAYGIPIIFDEQQIYGCSLTASLADEPLLEKLNLICRTMNGSYEVIDGQIVINIKSCRNSLQ